MDMEILKVLEALGMPIGVSMLWVFIYITRKDHLQEREHIIQQHIDERKQFYEDYGKLADKTFVALENLKSAVNDLRVSLAKIKK